MVENPLLEIHLQCQQFCKLVHETLNKYTKNDIVSVKICPVYQRWKICKTCEKSANHDGREIPARRRRRYRFLHFHVQLLQNKSECFSGGVETSQEPLYFSFAWFFFVCCSSAGCYLNCGKTCRPHGFRHSSSQYSLILGGHIPLLSYSCFFLRVKKKKS